MRAPDYAGSSIANLMAELERRLGTHPPLPGLAPPLAAAIPEGSSYVLCLFDGVGDHQLAHRSAASLASHRVGALDATFPSTTAVALASVATALAPAGHGIVSHFLHLGGTTGIVNALKWRTISGHPAEVDTASLLPETSWERLSKAGREPVTVQPGPFDGSPLSRLLYRGCRFEGIWSPDDWLEAVVGLARVPGRLVFAYWPFVDVAAHEAGQASERYRSALAEADGLWSKLVARLPDGAVAVGTADHGHVDYASADKVAVDRRGATVFGDPRALFLRTDAERARLLESDVPATLVSDPRHLFGPGDHPELGTRLPSHVLLADRGRLLLPSYMDDRLVGYHGGLEPEELAVPLLVAPLP